MIRLLTLTFLALTLIASAFELKALKPDDADSLNSAAMMMENTEISLDAITELCLKYQPSIGKELVETTKGWKRKEQALLLVAKKLVKEMDIAMAKVESKSEVASFMKKSTLARRTQLKEAYAVTLETLGEFKGAQEKFCTEQNTQYKNDRKARPRMYEFLENYINARD